VSRPAVSVVVPFAGSQEELRRTIDGLRALRRGAWDELIVADNRAAPVAPDADATPEPGLLDAWFDPPPGEGTAVLAGGIEDVAEATSAVARYVSARGVMDQRTTLVHPHAPYAQTANCAVRRAAFDAVGGFDEGARWGEDADLCWRLRAAGWELEERPGARVAHRNRDSLRALLAQQAGHGAGARWLNRAHPGSSPAPGPRELAGQARWFLRQAARAARAGEGDAARFALLDLLVRAAFEAGRLRSNRPRALIRGAPGGEQGRMPPVR
jgi:GT2 family glycosyltransferase